MTTTMQQRILRANAVWLVAAGCGSLVMDVLGIFFAHGPQRVIASLPHTGVGFIEAHGLAMIFGVMLWRAAPARLASGGGSGTHAARRGQSDLLAILRGDGPAGCRLPDDRAALAFRRASAFRRDRCVQSE